MKTCHLFHNRFPSKFASVSFCLIYVKAQSFGKYTFRISVSSGWKLILLSGNTSLFVSGNFFFTLASTLVDWCSHTCFLWINVRMVLAFNLCKLLK